MKTRQRFLPISFDFVVQYTASTAAGSHEGLALNAINQIIAYTKLTRSRVLLEKPPVAQILKNFPAVYGIRKFITVSTRTFH
jgi:hypothetical protein